VENRSSFILVKAQEYGESAGKEMEERFRRDGREVEEIGKIWFWVFVSGYFWWCSSRNENCADFLHFIWRKGGGTTVIKAVF
jgi:hypothetical protein